MNTVIYIDNDNIKFNKYEKLLMKMFKDHNTIYKIFINELDLSNLDSKYKLKHNIFLCTSPAKSKNSSDIRIVIECMDDIHSNNYTKFIIISNDTDFIPLCKRIHKDKGQLFLVAENIGFDPIVITEEMDFQIWGVVTFVVHSLR